MATKSQNKPSIGSRIVGKIKKDNEVGARKALIEELFYDFRRNRHEVYWMNFVRGLAFGLGSVLGGTIVIALLIWLLSTLGHFFPFFDQFFDGAANTIEAGKK